MFAVELMMPEVSVRTFLPVALATGAATFVARLFIGLEPAFKTPPIATLAHHPASFYALLLYTFLGVLTGLAAALFTQGLHWTESIFDRIRNSYFRHAIGMLIVGLMVYTLFQTFGHYYVEGVGYATVQDVLVGGLDAAPLLALLFACKLMATLLSLGSGASGGIFSPSLFMGATLGGAFGAFARAILPLPDLSVPAFAIVGMAAMVGGGTGAAMTGVTMIFEMTRDYDIVMPMIVSVAVSIGIRRILSRENIYTVKLVSRRHFIPKALHANMFLVASNAVTRRIARRVRAAIPASAMRSPATARASRTVPRVRSASATSARPARRTVIAPAGTYCVKGVCGNKKPCKSENDCAQNEDCVEGLCIAAEHKAPPPPKECTLEAVFFDFNESALTTEATARLAQDADCLKKTDRAATLVGHTDNRGTQEYNLALSERRAQSVRDHLGRLGIDGGKLTVLPRGALDAKGTDEPSWAQDRRVDFKWR